MEGETVSRVEDGRNRRALKVSLLVGWGIDAHG